jgi:ABC-type glucose/galactose transport system permease subunit
MCAENSGLAAQKTINTLVKYVLGYIHINSWHDVIQKVNILVLEINFYSYKYSSILSPQQTENSLAQF